jgi:diguanylate cyclase (GGDEF)-like protein
VVSGRKHVEAELRHLVGSDALTGLANLRQAMDALDGEIKRSQRNGRPLAVLFLDLDRLKRINDHHGHLAGNRALCRLADALRASSRAVDTAARLGGDEFVLILPETGEERAWQVAARLAQGVAMDTERPALSVSIGMAVYPRDGDSVEALLGAADRVLYDAKERDGSKHAHS